MKPTYIHTGEDKLVSYVEKVYKSLSNIDNFVDYCYEFYGPNGVYPNNKVTKSLILKATCHYLKEIKVPFEGDSIDRENVNRYLNKLINKHGAVLVKNMGVKCIK